MSEIIQREDTGEPARVVVSPYRICPIGAHSDHQGGPTLGMAVSAHTTLTFVATERARATLTSENFAGTAAIDLKAPGRPEGWALYPAAACAALASRLPDSPRGIEGRLRGRLPGSGLSSSASLLLACLTALAEVNGLALSPKDLVELSLVAERDHVGVKVGILDPAAIVGAKKDHLLLIDSRALRWEAVALGTGAPSYEILVAFSGVTRSLTGTDYNRRVEECAEAVRKLARATGQSEALGLHDFSDEAFEALRDELAPDELKRATHFFGERARVREGIERWRSGDLSGFGALMKASCESSIVNWETGSRELIDLQRRLERLSGVYGSRFSGAGFGGSVIALVENAAAVARELPVEAFQVTSDDGIRLL